MAILCPFRELRGHPSPAIFLPRRTDCRTSWRHGAILAIECESSGLFTLTNGTLQVVLNDDASGWVAADAVPELPALRQRQRRPRSPEPADGHGRQIDVPDAVGHLCSTINCLPILTTKMVCRLFKITGVPNRVRPEGAAKIWGATGALVVRLIFSAVAFAGDPPHRSMSRGHTLLGT